MAKLQLDAKGTLSGTVEEVRSGNMAVVDARRAAVARTQRSASSSIESRLASHLAISTAEDVTIEYLDEPESDLVIRYSSPRRITRNASPTCSSSARASSARKPKRSSTPKRDYPLRDRRPVAAHRRSRDPHPAGHEARRAPGESRHQDAGRAVRQRLDVRRRRAALPAAATPSSLHRSPANRSPSSTAPGSRSSGMRRASAVFK